MYRESSFIYIYPLCYFQGKFNLDISSCAIIYIFKKASRYVGVFRTRLQFICITMRVVGIMQRRTIYKSYFIPYNIHVCVRVCEYVRPCFILVIHKAPYSAIPLHTYLNRTFASSFRMRKSKVSCTRLIIVDKMYRVK